MNIFVLCSDSSHPVMPSLRLWQKDMIGKGHAVKIVHAKESLSAGDFLFLVSCSQIITADERSKYKAVLVLHASDLPDGRGWSPYIWSVLNGSNEITVCLLEAVDSVDSGPVWLRTKFTLEGHELLPEIHKKLFEAEISLMTQAIEQFPNIKPVAQHGDSGPYFRKRTPEDSRLDPHKPLAEQFNLLRVADSDRFPAFMDMRGHRYLIKIEKQK
jgi:methionyl-tRNA formyltransferase